MKKYPSVTAYPCPRGILTAKSGTFSDAVFLDSVSEYVVECLGDGFVAEVAFFIGVALNNGSEARSACSLVRDLFDYRELFNFQFRFYVFHLATPVSPKNESIVLIISTSLAKKSAIFSNGFFSVGSVGATGSSALMSLRS